MSPRRFRGGIHPPDHKNKTRGGSTARIGVPERVVLPMVQHLGAPCVPVVETGEVVRRGQLVGRAEAMVSAPVHTPVDGTVTALVETLTITGARVKAIEIAPEAKQDWDRFVPLEGADVVRTVRAAGIVGLGGAAFPSAVKLTPPQDMPISTVILNGCECEPYLTCDHRTMLERSGRVVAGGRIIAQAVGATRVVIGIEADKYDAVDTMRSAAGESAEVLVLPARYPQGAEKQLIRSVLGREVPHGALPAAVGVLVHNVSTAAAIADAVEDRRPLMERVVTVTGHVAHPGNYLVPIGTLVSDVLAAAGGTVGDVDRVIAGGPMTGMPLAGLDVPVVKATGGIVVFAPGETAPAVLGDQPCIRCARCVGACPMWLEPYAIGIYANRRDWDVTERYHAMDCIECGCCSYVCPTNRPLVQLIRRAKHVLMERGAKT